jgi:hypothetical protein
MDSPKSLVRHTDYTSNDGNTLGYAKGTGSWSEAPTSSNSAKNAPAGLTPMWLPIAALDEETSMPRYVSWGLPGVLCRLHGIGQA